MKLGNRNMSNDKSIADYRELLTSARQSYRDLISDLKLEKLADEQFQLQMSYLQKMAATPSADFTDICLKLRTWKEECFYSSENLMHASPEQKLVLSVIEDLAQISITSVATPPNLDVSKQVAA